MAHDAVGLRGGILVDPVVPEEAPILAPIAVGGVRSSAICFRGRASGQRRFTDFSLLKSTAINERCKLDFRVDFFNVFNRPNLSGMVSDLSSPSFATATSQYNPRWIEFSANFKF